MRRRFLLVVATMAAPVAAAPLIHGCSKEPPFESVCLWVANPDNCYRKFHIDMLANGEDCKPSGAPTPVNSADAMNPNGVSNGVFLTRPVLDICYITGGGQVVFDPPIDLSQYPLPLLSTPVTRTMTILRANGSACGVAKYTSPHGFSITIQGPPDVGTVTGPGSVDGGVSTPYGTFTEVIQPGRDAFDVTCPSGEAHHFNLYEVEGMAATDDGGAASLCPLFQDLVPRASLVIQPGGIGVTGAVSFTIEWPPEADVSYPDFPSATLGQGGTPLQPTAVTYFNCSIGAVPHVCLNGVKDGAETDIDCGGNETTPGCPARCGDGQGCVTDCDCDPVLVCTVKAGVKKCSASADGAGPPPRDCSRLLFCQNQQQDVAETDVDCGGSDCLPCADNKACLLDLDCQHLHCTGGVCAAATCGDGQQNQDETDVDCGGSSSGCIRCAIGKGCQVDTDCSNTAPATGVCLNKLCQ